MAARQPGGGPDSRYHASSASSPICMSRFYSAHLLSSPPFGRPTLDAPLVVSLMFQPALGLVPSKCNGTSRLIVRVHDLSAVFTSCYTLASQAVPIQLGYLGGHNRCKGMQSMVIGVFQLSADSFWALFGKLTAILGAAATVIGLWRYFTSPAEKISAVLTIGHFALPPRIGEDYQRLKEALSEESFKSEIVELAKSDSEKIHALTTLLMRARHKLPYSIVDEVDRYRGLCHIGVTNHGTKRAKGVRLIVPSGKLIQIRREGQEVGWRKIDEAIDLGDIQPGEPIGLYCWCETREVEQLGDRVRLTHDEGVGSVLIRCPARKFLADNELVLTTPIGWALVVATISCIGYFGLKLIVALAAVFSG